MSITVRLAELPRRVRAATAATFDRGLHEREQLFPHPGEPDRRGLPHGGRGAAAQGFYDLDGALELARDAACRHTRDDARGRWHEEVIAPLRARWEQQARWLTEDLALGGPPPRRWRWQRWRRRYRWSRWSR